MHRLVLLEGLTDASFERDMLKTELKINFVKNPRNSVRTPIVCRAASPRALHRQPPFVALAHGNEQMG